MARVNRLCSKSGQRTTVIASLLGVALIIAGSVVGQTTAQAQSADCGDWQHSHRATENLAVGDICRVCGDELQVLIVEDGYETLVAYPAGVVAAQSAVPSQPANCNGWHRATQSTKQLAPNDLYRVCDGQLQVLPVEDGHITLITHSIEN